MNKMKKLLSVVLAVVLAFSAFSVLGSAAKTAYKTVAELEKLDAYSPYGQVTRLSLEERTSIVFDALDNLLPGLNINMGKVFDVLGLSVTIDLTSIDRLCYSFDTIKDTFDSTLAGIAMGIVNLGILESLNVDQWKTGMTRAGTAQWDILSTIVRFLASNTTLVNKVLTDGLDLGIVSLGDMSKINDIVKDLPSLVKGLVFPKLERWDDTLSLIQTYDTNSKGNGGVESTVSERVQKLFSDNMSITTVKYDANGNMTSEHTGMPFRTSAPGTPAASDPRCVYVISGTTPGSTLKVYHIVDAEEAKASEGTDKVLTAYTYVEQEETYVLEQEVEGGATYVWKATKTDGMNTWTETLKWYNDDSQFLPGFDASNIKLSDANVSAGDLLYTFIPTVFKNLATVVLNGSVKKALAGFFGAEFKHIGRAGSDAVAGLGNDPIFAEEQGDYVFEWSDYAIVDGVHYYRYLDDIYVADLSATNNYFDVINWDFEITGDFMDEFVPSSDANVNDRLLLNLNDFLIKVADTVLVDSVLTEDSISGDTAQWTKPDFVSGGNENLVANIKKLAQTFVKLAPQHIFGSDYETNPRCYYNLLVAEDNDTVLTGIAAQLVDIIMPSMSLPEADDILASGAKVGAILAAVVREFAAYLTPEYNYDALIYTDFGENDGVKNFVTGQTSEYWFDVILTMGINVGFEYLRAFADMGEGSTEWNAFVAYSGYGVDGKTYAAGTTQAQLNAEWEGMLDYVIDWALDKDYEWTWKMENLVEVDGLTIDMATAQDPFVKLDKILFGLIPFDEILTITTTADYPTKVEKFLRYDLILGIVDLRWDALINTIAFNGENNYFRNGDILQQLANLLKNIVNGIFDKVGGGSYALIPDVISDFDSLANQGNLRTMVVNLVGALDDALITNGLAATLFPFLNFLLGWKTDPQEIADPQIWTSFRDGNDYAFQWTGNGVYPAMDADNTLIKVLNNSAGMLEKHRNSSVTDHAYDIQIKSVTSDATTNTLTFTYGDGNGLVSPYETLDIKIGGTFKGDESTTITIAYDYVGKDGQPIGGTQYTSLTVLFSDKFEDANISGRFSGDNDKDYAGTDDFGRYQFTENIYETVTNYQARIFYVGSTFSNPSKNKGTIAAPDYDQDCDGNRTYYDLSDASKQYFAFRAGDSDAGWASTLSKDGTSETYGYLYKAANGTTAETEIPYGAYYMGRIAVAYGSDNKQYEITFIHYNDYDIYDIYLENKDNGYHANQGVDPAIYEEYNEAWKMVVYGATYPMMTKDNPNTPAEADYVDNIQPYIPAAIERFEAAKEAYETALADAQASASSEADKLPSYITALQEEIDNDFMNGKEINFQDYEFYEYFNYEDVKEAAEELYRSYLRPEIMDTYYILGSGIGEAELNEVIAAEDNEFIAAGITASRMMNDQAAIDASIAAHNDWVMPITTKLYAEDFVSRLAYYKSFLNAANREDADHMYFLNKEIAYVEAQGLIAEDYEAVTWGRYADALAEAKAVAAGTDEFSAFNSRIYDVKYNLMVAYKQLLLKDNSLIEAGGTEALNSNIEIANEIFASLAAGDGAWTLKEGVNADKAYADLISARGYYYVGEDGNTWNLYADSALEYADNDRPNKQANQAKVDAANAELVAAIANFEPAEDEMEPSTLMVKEDFEYADYVVIDTNNNNYGEYTGIVYGIDTLDQNEMMEVLGDLASALTTNNGDDYLVIEGNENGMESTGATITVVDENGDTLETYVFVYFGDIDGDGMISTNDAFIAEYYEGTYEGVETYAQYVSADIDGDGMPSANDAYIMEYYEGTYEGVDYQYNLGQNAMNNTYEWIF